MLTGKKIFSLPVGGLVARRRWQTETQQQVHRAAADATWDTPNTKGGFGQWKAALLCGKSSCGWRENSQLKKTYLDYSAWLWRTQGLCMTLPTSAINLLSFVPMKTATGCCYVFQWVWNSCTIAFKVALTWYKHDSGIGSYISLAHNNRDFWKIPA